jgi:hypothetical protein
MTKFANEGMGVKMLRRKGRRGLENIPNSMESFGLNRMVKIKKRQMIVFLKDCMANCQSCLVARFCTLVELQVIILDVGRAKIAGFHP